MHAQAVGHGDVQHLGLVGMLGSEADLQPVVDVQAPGRRRLAQLLEAAQAAVGHSHAECLTVWLVAHLPVVFPTVDQRVPCRMGWAVGTGYSGVPDAPPQMGSHPSTTQTTAIPSRHSLVPSYFCLVLPRLHQLYLDTHSVQILSKPQLVLSDAP